MPKTKPLTVTIGIPAHNEEANLPVILKSVFEQNRPNFILDTVIVMCDGCTDNTESIGKNLQKKYPELVILNDGQRLGKAERVNQFYTMNQSDLFLCLDADVAFDRPVELTLMVQEMIDHPEVTVVGPRYIPVPAQTWWGKCAVISYLSFEDAFRQINEGYNFYTLMGACSLIRRSITQKLQLPPGTISDQNYLYAYATQKNSRAVKIAWNSRLFFRTVESFSDWRKLSTRAVVKDRENVVKFFGPEILERYSMPREIYLKSLLKFFRKDPIHSLGSLFMNIFIRVFPYKQKNIDSGVWETTQSSKVAIK